MAVSEDYKRPDAELMHKLQESIDWDFKSTTPKHVLDTQLMDPRIAKTELEHYAARRIQALEAPYKLTDTPPSEPGWYAAIWQGRVMYCEVTKGNHGLKFNGQYAEPDSSVKWGSAPLPLPEVIEQ